MAYESDPIASKLNELIVSQDMLCELTFLDDLGPAPQALLGTWQLANEIYNGGFAQYFDNHGGRRAHRMVDVLRSFDATEAAALLQRAIEIVGPLPDSGPAELDCFAFVKTMPVDLRAELVSLEKHFYEQCDGMHGRLYRYLSRHREELTAPREFWTEKGTP